MAEQTLLSKIIAEQANVYVGEVLGSVNEENFNAVSESLKQDFRMGAVSLAGNMKYVFQLLELTNDPNCKTVTDYLEKFIKEQTDELDSGVKHLNS